jgi:hypothetical protein
MKYARSQLLLGRPFLISWISSKNGIYMQSFVPRWTTVIYWIPTNNEICSKLLLDRAFLATVYREIMKSLWHLTSSSRKLAFYVWIPIANIVECLKSPSGYVYVYRNEVNEEARTLIYMYRDTVSVPVYLIILLNIYRKLTPRKPVLLKKPTVSEPLNKFPIFYGNRKISIIFKSQMYPVHISLCSIIWLSSHPPNS